MHELIQDDAERRSTTRWPTCAGCICHEESLRWRWRWRKAVLRGQQKSHPWDSEPPTLCSGSNAFRACAHRKARGDANIAQPGRSTTSPEDRAITVKVEGHGRARLSRFSNFSRNCKVTSTEKMHTVERGCRRVLEIADHHHCDP
jgi:hypothetical protein